ncbi:aldo/keto reductase [Chitinophaga oryziterrae]|nr:aldo/keto reductase [Chitinophaga oryziterrae]
MMAVTVLHDHFLPGMAAESSLNRLKTDYIDIYMPHYDDGLTPIEEIARGLEDLVKSGKLITGVFHILTYLNALIK